MVAVLNLRSLSGDVIVVRSEETATTRMSGEAKLVHLFWHRGTSVLQRNRMPMLIHLAQRLVHLKDGFLSVDGGGYEYPLVLLLVLLFFAAAGSGRFGLDAMVFKRGKAKA